MCKYRSHNDSDNYSLYAPSLLSNDKSDSVSQFNASKLQSYVPKALGVAARFVLFVGPTLKYIRQNNK